MNAKAGSVLATLLMTGWSFEGNAQQPAPLPSPSAQEDEEPDLIPIEPPLLVPEPKWEQRTLPVKSLQFAGPPAAKPILPPLRPDIPSQNALASSVHVFVKEYRFTGNRVFSSATLAKVVEKYSGREITAEELEQARQDLTLYYISRGFINSGATLPDQSVESGIITFAIVEGRLSQVNISGNYWFRPWWLRSEVRRAGGQPLNFNKLKEGLQLLRTNQLISRINAELKPGGVPGESIIDVQIKDTQPFRFGLQFSNDRPPSVGSEIVEALFADLNLTGHNDPLQLRYGIAHTTPDSGFDFSGLDNIEGTYEFPITPWATTLQLHGNKSDTSIIEEPFLDLNIDSKLEEYGLTLRQPLYQTLANDLAVSFTVDRRRNETFLFGRPFSLSPGAVNGVTSVFVLRWAQEFVNRSQVHVLSLRSTFSLGLDGWDATNSGSEPDARFFAWLGQGQYVRRLGDTNYLLILRLNGQASNDPLFSLEQFTIGGADTVRGYRENTVLRDNGIFGSVEMRFPIIYGKEHAPILTVAPFFDVGAGWNTLSEGNSHKSGGGSQTQQDRNGEVLPSAGIGLIFTPHKYVHAQIYWGYGFNRSLVESHSNLQDYGIHFVVTVSNF